MSGIQRGSAAGTRGRPHHGRRVAAARHAAALTAVAALVHLTWAGVTRHRRAVVLSALAGVALTWALYAVAAAASRRWRWPDGPWTRAQAYAVSGGAMVAGMVSMVLGAGIAGAAQAVLIPVAVLLAERVSDAPRAELDPTVEARRRYDRVAPVYDLMEWVMELRFRPWRRALWHGVDGDRVLELGVGTGKNLPFYPPGARCAALDLSPEMLKRAQRRARRRGIELDLVVGDAQALPFADGRFDVVVATFLFCSVPDPVAGLREARRVLAPGGRLLLLEHVLSRRPVLRRLMRWLDPLPFHIWGAHIDRETDRAVAAAGFELVECEDLSLDVVKRIQAGR